MRHAVSDYAVGPTKATVAVAGVANAAGAGLLAVAVAAGGGAVAAMDRRTEMIWLLAIYAVLAVVVLAAPTDLEGQRRTMTGRLHLLIAVASFTAGYLLTADGTRDLAGLPGWAPLAGMLEVLRWATLAGLVGVVVTLLVRPLRAVFGVVERVFLGALLLWCIVVAAGLAFLA